MEIIRAGFAPDLVEYQVAWDAQREIHAGVVAGTREPTVLLLEHPSVYTAGKRTELADRPVDGTPVVEVDRGGKITWHGPGQLVGYPIVPLGDPLDVVGHVRRLEQLLIDTCAGFGLDTVRIDGRSGVWVDDAQMPRKVAAIGVRVSYGVTMHGFALNCNPDLAWFDRIVPCGLRDASVTSLTAELGRDITVSEAADELTGHLERILSAAVRA